MSAQDTTSYTVFEDTRLLANGPLAAVTRAVGAALTRDPAARCLAFDDATGALVDLDLRGSAAGGAPEDPGPPVRGRGRPRLGVVAREVTLLPRHWDWLATQPGTASQTLRRLVDDARRRDGGRSAARAGREAAYRFLAAIAGDFPGFEEASRALFAGERARFLAQAAEWPVDVRGYADRLAGWDPQRPRAEAGTESAAACPLATGPAPV